jgi:hypothetical protein
MEFIIELIPSFFGGVTTAELKALTTADQLQLASAIARSLNLSAEECDFETVEY